MFLVVAYDIVDDTQRQRLAALLADYGQRVNYSVFECDLTPETFTQLLTVMPGFVRQRGDQVRVHRLCGHCERKTAVFGPDLAANPVLLISV